MKMKRLFASAAIALSVASGGAMFSAAPAQAATQVGTLSQYGHLYPYCQKVIYPQFAAKWTYNVTPDNAFNPYSWRCRAYIYSTGFDMNRVCKYYFGANAYAKVTNPNWAWDSWKCYR